MTFLASDRHRFIMFFMSRSTTAASLDSFATFGELLKFLRRRARLTQRELSIAAGYSEAQISRLERNERLPDLAAILALLAPALDLEDEPETVARLLELATIARGESAPEQITVERAVVKEARAVTEDAVLPGNLPLSLTSFIGRDREVTNVRRLLSVSRLVTLTGAGGCGKSRLALAVARQEAPFYRDGVWWVELAPLADATLLLPTIAAIFGLRPEAGRPLSDTLPDSLRGKQLLLILDNCEHLIDGCAQLAATLLQSAAHLSILATSREILAISGESTLRVPPLAVPDGRQSPTPEAAASYEAIKLFCERATAVRPTFQMTPTNTPYVIQICRRLDGMPLAIELAAVRISLLPAAQIAERLDDRFRLLAGGSRTARLRQQTLRALIDWSYDLLSMPEQMLLQRLSVFAGGWTLAAAEAVCAGEPSSQEDVLELLNQLVNKSLVAAEREPGQESRYQLLETIRQYAGEKLEQSGPGERVRQRRLAYYLELAETAAPHLHGPDQVAWLDRLETEIDNLRLSLAWASQHDLAAALRLGGAMAWFWNLRSYLSEGRQWLAALDEAHLAAGSGQEANMGRVWHGTGMLAWCQGEYTAAQTALEESVRLCRQLGDRPGLAEALCWLANVLLDRGQRQAAYLAASESQALSQQIGEEWLEALALVNLGHVAGYEEAAASRRYLETSVTLLRRAGDWANLSYALANLAPILMVQHDLEAAEEALAEALALAEQVGDRLGMAWITFIAGSVAQKQGRHELAARRYEQARAMFSQLGAQAGMASVARRQAENEKILSTA
ncbi:MAG TPA: tetratricopeptide repeat protein [Chloroflexota bacterium]|nr:tetratricopeptide repeat protein [Chloroflexota bacterium]